MVNEVNSPDSPAGDLGGRWMTMAEIAALRGISEASASRLVRRNKWRRQPDNREVVRTLVPSGWEVWSDRKPDVQDGMDSPDSPGQISLAINALHDAVAALREQLSRAEAGRETERARAGALRDQVASLQAQLAAAEAEAKAINDWAWATGEQLAAAEQRAATERERVDRLASSVAHERQDFLDAESRTRRELDEIRLRLSQAEQGSETLQARLTVAERVAEQTQAQLAKAFAALEAEKQARPSSGILAWLRRVLPGRAGSGG